MRPVHRCHESHRGGSRDEAGNCEDRAAHHARSPSRRSRRRSQTNFALEAGCPTQRSRGLSKEATVQWRATARDSLQGTSPLRCMPSCLLLARICIDLILRWIESRMTSALEAWLPKSILLLRDYDRHKFVSDLIAGVTVGLVALPLAMAFAIASGVPPQAGLYCAIVTGFLISAQEPRADGVLQTRLRRHSGSNRKRHRQRQRDETYGHAGDEVRHKFVAIVVAQQDY